MKKQISNLVIVLLLILFACNQSNHGQVSKAQKTIIVYFNGCSGETEITSDLEHSIESNQTLLDKNQIKVQFDTIQNKCGYILKWDNKEKEALSAMTDIELQEFVKNFFNIK
jgi:hypothetical protein